MMIGLLVARLVAGQSVGDQCHVYMGPQSDEDLKKIEKVLEEVTDQKELERRLSEFVKILGRFDTTVGEEESTTKSYEIPGTKLHVTVTVFYTDESMGAEDVGSDSMLLSLAISSRSLETAQGAPESAQAEVSMGRFAGKVRVKKVTVLNGKEYLIGLECERKAGRPTR